MPPFRRTPDLVAIIPSRPMPCAGDVIPSLPPFPTTPLGFAKTLPRPSLVRQNAQPASPLPDGHTDRPQTSPTILATAVLSPQATAARRRDPTLLCLCHVATQCPVTSAASMCRAIIAIEHAPRHPLPPSSRRPCLVLALPSPSSLNPASCYHRCACQDPTRPCPSPATALLPASTSPDSPHLIPSHPLAFPTACRTPRCSNNH
ncbi:hypothetical protein E2562_027356 [Oryza meyeriana var. granulata]|uniref:Uncharacterized protein n=1 Tax=Oryza meyeriana var. granulata TaxID=110450 RepID=A0A6G1C9B5_9ORYZ|nr:hypothetical protein E2562_027356 [Oryza meyeriana var. granulata]